MTRRLLVASRSRHKVAELHDLLDLGDDVVLVSSDEVGIEGEPIEDADSFEGNAEIKVRYYAERGELPTLADDSGLEVDALDGAPGIFTARYGGPGLSPVQRYEYLLHNLKDVPWVQRSARFRCVIAIASEDKRLLASADGICEGMIASMPSGDGGFGYDPVFYLPERGLTMAQLPSAEKHVISHRGQALQAIEPALREILEDTKIDDR